MFAAAIAVGKWLVLHPFQVLTVVLAGALFFEHGALKSERREHATDVATLTAERDAWKLHADQGDANLTAAKAANDQAAKALNDATRLAAANAQARDDADARSAAATKRIHALQTQLAAAADRERQTRVTIYAQDPDCAAWSRAPICGGIDQWLRFGTGKASSAGAHGGDGADDHAGGPAPIHAAAGSGHGGEPPPALSAAGASG